MSKLNVMAINGSPNEKGNTAFLLTEVLSECEKLGACTELLHCQQLIKMQKMPFCIVCSSPCSGKCYQDTEFEKILEKISLADALIAGSPVYFGNVSAQLKAVWDKGRKLRTEKKLLNVVGGALSVGGSRFGGQETTLRTIHDMFLVQGMIVVGDGYHEDDCGHTGAAAQRPAWEDDNAIKRAGILGKRIYEVASATSSLRRR